MLEKIKKLLENSDFDLKEGLTLFLSICQNKILSKQMAKNPDRERIKKELARFVEKAEFRDRVESVKSEKEEEEKEVQIEKEEQSKQIEQVFQKDSELGKIEEDLIVKIASLENKRRKLSNGLKKLETDQQRKENAKIIDRLNADIRKCYEDRDYLLSNKKLPGKDIQEDRENIQREKNNLEANISKARKKLSTADDAQKALLNEKIAKWDAELSIVKYKIYG